MKVLYTLVDPEEKYKAQNFNDTVVFRGGDAASAWVLNGFRAVGLGFGSIVAVTLPAALAWLWLSFSLGRTPSRGQRSVIPKRSATLD